METLFILVLIISVIHGAKILGIFHMPSYSHFQLADTLIRELAARGHEVVFFTPFEMKSPLQNITQVVLADFVKETSEFHKEYIISETNVLSRLIWLDKYGLYATESVLKHPAIQKLLASDEHFDLVIFENFINDAFCGFAHHFKAPYVVLNSFGPSRWSSPKMGNPNNPAYISDWSLSYSGNMNFFQRFHNVLVYGILEWYSHMYTYPTQNELLQKYFPGAPHLYDLMYNASLMLLNYHTSIGASVPLVPNMIEIGGYHIRSPKPLPSHLQDYLDKSENGVILFTMGSIIESRYLPLAKLNEITKSLGKLKENVLWRWEEDILPDHPSNVKTEKWLPQQDILAHPNVKLFITHGGLLGTIEAVYYGVPVLGIPVVSDQHLNMANAQDAGFGISVPFQELTESALTSALNEILHNKKYLDNAKKRSTLMRDQHTQPLDKAIYWIEYVVKHQGADHLKTTALKLSWHQYLLLDVILVLVLRIFGGFLILYELVKFIIRVVRKRLKVRYNFSEAKTKKLN